MREGYNSNRSGSNNQRRGDNFRPRGRGPFRGHQPYRPPTQGQIDHLMLLAQESVAAETGFSKLPMESLLLGALKSETFDTPTPIQAQAIPLAMMGRDILGCAQTGTGKTLAFVIPMLNQLLQKPDSKALILAPTRELALQIEEVIKPLTKKINLGLPVLLIGGVSYHNQFRGLEEPHRIIVATPGRLIDHLGQQTVNLSAVQSLVLDEADRMLDVGFKPQLLEILQYLPTERQTMMFSATLSAGVKSLSAKYLKNPAHLSVGETDRAHANITQKVIQLETSKKNQAVLDLLKEHEGTALIFVKTQIKTERIATILADYGVNTAPIHGGLNQGQRKRALESFRREEVRVLVATDVAARGLDIDHVGLVINYDLPQVIEDYVHRVGRTGRAGKLGVAVSLVSGEDRGLWRIIERKYVATGPHERSDSKRSDYQPRQPREGGYQKREQSGYKKRESGFEPRRESTSSFRPREEGGYKKRESSFEPRRERTSSFRPREEGGYKKRESSFEPRRERSEFSSEQPRKEYSPRAAASTGYTKRPVSEAPFKAASAKPETRFTKKAAPRSEDRAEGGWESKRKHFSKKPQSTGPFKGGKGAKKTLPQV